MIKINCHWYSYEEVREALEKKGYTILVEETDRDRHGQSHYEWFAIKDGKTQPISSAAIDEFGKRPPLV